MSDFLIIGDEGKAFVKNFNKTLDTGQAKKLYGTKGYYREGKRDYTAFRVNKEGKLVFYKGLQHEGDCRTKLKLKKL